MRYIVYFGPIQGYGPEGCFHGVHGAVICDPPLWAYEKARWPKANDTFFIDTNNLDIDLS